MGQEESVCIMWQPALAENCCETAVATTRGVLLLTSLGVWILFKAFYKLRERFPTYLTCVLLWSADRQRFLGVFQGCLLFACCQGLTPFFPPATDRLYFRCSGCQQSAVMEQKYSGVTWAVSDIDTFLKSSSMDMTPTDLWLLGKMIVLFFLFIMNYGDLCCCASACSLIPWMLFDVVLSPSLLPIWVIIITKPSL